MKKLWTGLIFSWCFCVFSFIASQSWAQVIKPAYKLSYHHDILTIKNVTKKPLNLSHAQIKFFAENALSAVHGQEVDVKTKIEVQDYTGKPNFAGNYTTITLEHIDPVLLQPGQAIHLQFLSDQPLKARNIELMLDTLVPVQVQVTVVPAGWTQTIQVCNNSAYPIPLTNIEFDFNFAGSLPASAAVWGSPWVNWKVSSQQGQQVVLTGGTTWATPMAPDPNCSNPMTIQFSSSPTTPIPTGPFTFKSVGGHPIGNGAMDIALSAAPGTGLANPQVTVVGMGTTQQQALAWGSHWNLTNLVPGTYTVTAAPVNNGQAYFAANPATVNVVNQQTAQVAINYASVPMTVVNVSLVGAPAAQETINFVGRNYRFSPSLANNATFTLPADTYTVSSTVQGYAASVVPNPLTVPGTNALTVTYTQSNTAGARFVGYYQSWSSTWATDGSTTDLAKLPSYVNVVNLAFMQPDTTYQKNSFNLAGTGLQFNYANGQVLKQAVAALHQSNPNTKVMVSVGGSSYTNWAGLNARAIADFVVDYGLDGVDIDFEPSSPGCALGSDNLMHCQTDNAFISYVQALRTLLPSPYWITIAGWSVGAYGQDQWVSAQPPSQYTGMVLGLLRSPAASQLDMVNVMSYDASNSYDPSVALAAYSHYFAGPIAMGVEVPPEAWGGHVYSVSQVKQLAQAVVNTATLQHTSPAMMLWSLQKQPSGTPSPSNPSAQMMATEICTDLGLSNCSAPL
jgi:chitinase